MVVPLLHPTIPTSPTALRKTIVRSRIDLVQELPLCAARRRRRVRPSGRRRIAATICGAKGRPGRLRSDEVVAALVLMVRVVVCTVLVAVKARVVGANAHDAEAGRVPQAKVTVPVKPPTGVAVITVEPVAPWTMVRDVGVSATVKVGTTTICVSAAEVLPVKLASPP